MRLSGKVAVITGGARGFGAAAATLFAQNGASVVIGDLLDDEGAQVVARIRDGGGKAEFVHTDVTSAADVRALTERATTVFSKLDVLVANAGVLLPGKVDELTQEQYDTQMDVNVKGVWLACKYAVPLMREAGGGSIVITSSAAGLRGSKSSALYSASKGAVLMFGKALALQTTGDNIRCNIVCPGPVATEFYRLGGISPEEYDKLASGMIPMGHLGDSVDMAYAMLFFASDESKFCTGAVLSADGGFTA